MYRGDNNSFIYINGNEEKVGIQIPQFVNAGSNKSSDTFHLTFIQTHTSMADTTPTAPPKVAQEGEEQKATETVLPAVDATATTAGTKRAHPDYDDKTKEQLVETEKKKIKEIHVLVSEVQHDSEKIDAKIAEARSSANTEERKELITEIKEASTHLKDMVHDAAVLEGQVVEINEVLKERKEAEDKGETTATTPLAATTTTTTVPATTTTTLPATTTETVAPTTTAQ